MERNVSVLLVILLLVPYVLAEPYQADDPLLNDWDSVDFSTIPEQDFNDLLADNYIPKNRYNDPAIPWDSIDQSKVPEGGVEAIPKDKLKLDGEGAISDDQLSEVTSEQVEGRAKELQGRDLDKLSQEVKEKVIAELTPVEKPKVETEPDTKFTEKEDHVEFNKIKKFTTPTFQFTDAENIKVYNNGCWDIEKASIVDFFGIANAEVNNFNGCQDKKYHIDYAESVRAGCFDAREVKDADIEINGNLFLQTKKDTQFDIFYGFRNQLEYKSTETDNQLTFDPGACSIPFYQIRGINLTIPSNQATETIEANSEAGVTLSRDNGVHCVQFSPTGTYTYTPEEIRNAFALRTSKENHRVCIRKVEQQDLTQCEQCTNVDFTINEIQIDGKVEYRRMQYNDDLNPINILSPGLEEYYTTLDSSKSTLRLSNDLHQVELLDAKNPAADDQLIVTNWLTFTQFRDQRDAFINLQIADYSEPLAKVYQAPAFENIDVEEQRIAAGQYLFYFPENEATEDFFRKLIQRRDLNFPTQAQS